MVDNVDKGLWITHKVFVNNDHTKAVFTHGNTVFFILFLQDFLPEYIALFVENLENRRRVPVSKRVKRWKGAR